MPTGVIINVCATAFGGLVGVLVRPLMRENLRSALTMAFGLSATMLGIHSIILAQQLQPVILALILGTGLGTLMKWGSHVEGAARSAQRSIGKLWPSTVPTADEQSNALLSTAIVLFCASGTGIYGALDAGMTGNHSILTSKAILDFFTAIVFGCTLGSIMSFIAIPQCAVMLVLFYAARWIFPWVSPVMLADFKACGGVLIFAAGLRIMKIVDFSLIDMLPAFLLVMPLSQLWSSF